MSFSSDRNIPQKRARAQLLALSMAILLVRGGERVGLLGNAIIPPSSGDTQLGKIAVGLAQPAATADYVTPNLAPVTANARVILFSDFLAASERLTEELSACASRRANGALLQVLDPQELHFPFRGRTIFESIGRSVEFETLKANELRQAYLEKLSARQNLLRSLCRETGFFFNQTQTEASAQADLLWLYRAVERRN